MTTNRVLHGSILRFLPSLEPPRKEFTFKLSNEPAKIRSAIKPGSASRRSGSWNKFRRGQCEWKKKERGQTGTTNRYPPSGWSAMHDTADRSCSLHSRLGLWRHSVTRYQASLPTITLPSSDFVVGARVPAANDECHRERELIGANEGDYARNEMSIVKYSWSVILLH